MGKTQKQKPEQEVMSKPRARDVFLVVSDPDLAWLEAEAAQREEDRLGYKG